MIGLALIIVIAIVGAIRKPRGPRYWIFCAAAAAYFAFLGPFLFYAGGTLDNPAADGVITRAVRAATADGPLMGLWAIAVLFALYGGTAWFLVAAIREQRKLSQSAAAPEVVAPPVVQLKSAETLPPSDESFRDAQERPLTARQKSLSGWARLWIVIAALFWAWGAFYSYQIASQYPCASMWAPDESVRPYTCDEALRRGLIDPASLIWPYALAGWAIFAGYAVAIWLLAMAAKSVALWVWRGFRTNIKPGAN